MDRQDRGFRRQSSAPIKVGDVVDVTIEAVGEKGDGLAKIVDLSFSFLALSKAIRLMSKSHESYAALALVKSLEKLAQKIQEKIQVKKVLKQWGIVTRKKTKVTKQVKILKNSVKKNLNYS